MERERERETGYSNFRSRDKRSVLTRCSSNKQAESFSISSEKRGKRIEEVDVDPRAACTQSRPILAVTLLGKFGGEDNAWNTPREHDTPLEGSKNRCIASLDCRQLWYTDEWEGMLGAKRRYMRISTSSSRRRAAKIRARIPKRLDGRAILSFSFFSTNTIKRTIRDPFDKSRATDLSKRNSVQRNRYFSIYLYEAENFSSPMGRGSSLILVIFPLAPSREAVFELRR